MLLVIRVCVGDDHVKNLVFIIIVLVLFPNFIIASKEAVLDFFPNSQSGSQLLESPTIVNASLPCATDTSITGFSEKCVKAKILQVLHNGNETVCVVLEPKDNLTVVNVGSSTLIELPRELKTKIDPNLLNLTRLVDLGYLQNNKTNVLISVAPQFVFSELAEKIIKKNFTDEIREIYVSEHAFSFMKFMATRIKYSALFELTKSPFVDYIWLDRKFEVCLDQSVVIVKDPAEWTIVESSFGRQINGSGIRIAILDTGIDLSHPDFYFSNGTSKIVAETSFTGESTIDRYGHGTHCASIAAGTGVASTYRYVGVAPSAALLNVKVLDDTGEGLESWIISGIQWAVDNGADIISMSFGGDITNNGTDPLSTTVDWASKQGAICVVAAGNAGSTMYTITSPGVAKLAITVGASSKADTVPNFSSRGPTIDNRIKPDLVAPGVNIIAARANSTTMGTPVSQYYTRASGTSMATPHVAGAAALLLDAHPDWDYAIIKMALTNYPENIGSNVLEQGSGRLDICKSAIASIIGNSSTSFGRVHLNATYNQLITFQNLADTTFGVALDVETWLIESGVLYNVALLNASNLNIATGTAITIELQLDTNLDLPTGYFEGRITATFNGGSIKIPFLFYILSQLNCEIINENGSRLTAAFILLDAESGELVGYSAEDAQAQFTVSPGEYIIQAMNVYGLNPSSGHIDMTYSFLVHQKVSIKPDETIYLQLSLASASKLRVRTTDITNSSLHLELKQLFAPNYQMIYLSEIGALSSQHLYLTNISEYATSPCYFGFMGFSKDDIRWEEANILTSEVDAYFVGWDIGKHGLLGIPDPLEYADYELATFDIENLFPTPSAGMSIWFNQIAGLWQTGFWYGFQTYPGINWKAHVLPCQFKQSPSAEWSEMEWSCIYAPSLFLDYSAEYFVVDRHFQPIVKGEMFSYTIGKTLFLPQPIHNGTSYYGESLQIPYYPLRVQENLFLEKTNPEATKRVEVFKDEILIYNKTKLWAQDPILITSFLESHGYGYYSFVIKTETSMDLCSKNIAKYEINYTNLSRDLIPPSIVKINASPCFTTNEYFIEIQIVDNEDLQNVSLFYSIGDGHWTSAPIENLDNGIYSTDLNLEPSTQQLSLAIEARDISGNAVWSSIEPAARRGYPTQINATLNADRISGKLMIIGGVLSQPVYLKIKMGENVMYTLTDNEGNFEFMVPQSVSFPVRIEMINMGPYGDSSCLIWEPEIHDVAITQVTPFKTVISSNVQINVTIANQGIFVEIFNVALCYNSSCISNATLTLISGSSTTITFTWNTTSIVKGNYSISAYASQVWGETYTDNNILIFGIIHLTIPGDFSGDLKVDPYDFALLVVAYGSTPWKPGMVGSWNSNCDVDCNNKVDPYDFAVLSVNYGKHYS